MRRSLVLIASLFLLDTLQWKVVATHMRLRGGLDGQQVRDITVFLQGSN